MQTFAMPVYMTVQARDGKEAMELMAQAMMKAQAVPGVVYRRPLEGFNEPIEEPTPGQPFVKAFGEGTDQADETTEEEPP